MTSCSSLKTFMKSCHTCLECWDWVIKFKKTIILSTLTTDDCRQLKNQSISTCCHLKSWVNCTTFISKTFSCLATVWQIRYEEKIFGLFSGYFYSHFDGVLGLPAIFRPKFPRFDATKANFAGNFLQQWQWHITIRRKSLHSIWARTRFALVSSPRLDWQCVVGKSPSFTCKYSPRKPYKKEAKKVAVLVKPKLNMLLQLFLKHAKVFTV